MANITKLVRPSHPQHFEAQAALNLVQAFHRHLDLSDLLILLFSQTQVLVHTAGLTYTLGEKNINLSFGSTEGHCLSYQLNLGETALGEIKFYSRQRFSEVEIETVEDLTSLVVTALNNAILYEVAHQPRKAKVALTPAANTQQNKDALILISIDGFNQVVNDQGELWAQTLLDAVTTQVQGGLRHADHVYQIDKTHLAVLLPRTNNNAALEVAEKLRTLIAALHLREGSISKQLTACMGVATSAKAESPDIVVKRAKTALLRAQKIGLNQVRVAEGI